MADDKYVLGSNQQQQDRAQEYLAKLLAVEGQYIMAMKWLVVAIYKLGGKLEFIPSEWTDIVVNSSISMDDDDGKIVVTVKNEAATQ